MQRRAWMCGWSWRPASGESDLDTVFPEVVKQRVGALLVSADSFLASRRARIVMLAAQSAVTAISQNREYVVAGGLMSYEASFSDAYRVLGFYAGRILKGEKPAELPVQQTTKVELIINLKTAKVLGRRACVIARPGR